MIDTETQTSRLNPDRIIFRTDQVWRADEFSRFIEAVQRIYEPFLAVHVVRNSGPNPQRELSRVFRQAVAYYRTLVEEYERARRRYPEARGRYPESERLILPPLAGTSPETTPNLLLGESDFLAFVYNNLYSLAPENRLTIASIHISSPGWISFQGLGEPLQQVREFIKDIWYRNKQEKELGRLEIARQRLQLQRDYGDLLSGPANDLAVATLQEIQVLEQLELEGKLVDVADNVDSDTFDAGADEG